MSFTTLGTDINIAADFLRRGKLVAIPTETVYGLAGNALDEKVVLDIFKMKNRPAFDPLIVHIANIDSLNQFTENIPENLTGLMEEFWPGPLTILLKKKNIIPDLVTSGLENVAVRIPDNPLTLELLNKLDFPLAAPSANPFGYISPTTAQHVSDQFSGKIPYILDGGACRVGIESTIIGFENGDLIIYRLGGTKISDIEKQTGSLKIKINSSSGPNAPGMLMNHYAPSKNLYFGDLNQLVKEHLTEQAGIICLRNNRNNFPEKFIVRELSPEGNLDEAAKNLFSVMRELDCSDISCILAERFPDEGLGKAINDRLKRAASNK